MDTLFETARLTVRPLRLDDADFVLRLFNAPNWLQFLPDRQVRTREAAGRYLREVYLQGYADNGFGAWAVTLQGEPIGICGLFRRPYLPIPDLGYALLPDFEGRGYAFEAAAGALSYVRDHLGMSSLAAVVSEANTRSVQLLERLGFDFKESVLIPGEDRAVSVFVVDLFR